MKKKLKTKELSTKRKKLSRKEKKLGTKKRNKIVLMILLIIVVVIALIFTIKSSELKDMMQVYVSTYGLIGIIILTTILELLWQPLGPEVLITFGILFGLNATSIFIFTVAGSYSASLINYFLGRKYLSKKLMFSLETEDRSKYRNLFKKYGKWAVFLAAIGPIPWVLFCWLAGSFKMKFRKFFAWGLFPRLLRILVVVLLVRYLNVVLF